jgi:GNAT superfamily N-acetyltransferase
LEDPALSNYWVAESSNGEVVASTSAVREWSNFNGGYYWWVQSMFIVPKHRGRGLVDLLLDTVAEEARAAGAVDLRLYACGSNLRALDAYRRCGFDETPYVIMRRPLDRD